MMRPHAIFNLMMFRKIFTLVLLIGLSISCTNSGSKTNESDINFNSTQGIAGTITGDIVSNVRVDLEKADGTPVLVATTDKNGAYLFPGSELSEGSYVVIPSKDNTQFVPSKTTVNYVRSGVNRVDFGGLFAFPDTVTTRSINIQRTPLDVVATVGGNQIYVSLHPIDKTKESENSVDLGTRVSIIRSFTTIQDGTANFDYDTGRNMAIKLLVSSDGAYLYALNIHNGGLQNNVVAYKLNAGDGLNLSGTFALDPGLVPNDMAISPDNKKLYVACEGQNSVIVVSAITMTSQKTLIVTEPISLATSNDYLFVLSKPTANGVITYSYLNRFYSAFEEKVGDLPIDKLRIKKIVMGLDKQKFYLLTEKTPDFKSKLIEYGIDGNRGREHEFESDYTPTNMIITPNNKQMYITLDYSPSEGKIGILDFDTFTRKTISGVGSRPIGIGIALSIAPNHILGMVINEGESTISIMK
jgi:hypothetical protein